MADEKTTANQSGQEQTEQGNFTIQRIYLKDASYESPNSPSIFLKNWEPEINVNLHTNTEKLDESTHEVVLKVTVTATHDKQTVFITEVQQAGIFAINNMEGKELHYVLGSFCPGLLFPYARETISNFVARGGFPHFYLAPVDFDQIYQQHLEQQAAKKTDEE